ncbi:cytosolic acyl coenzyme A thioester hydrolase-like isoform X1 [Sycon ciliatum]|uniref:cytosolic acyl coenzyme A thioester hydrolase-like isoform X1 n=2 Tax=Sycon ciliatum TaxID=27933 RepID=UPI0020A9E8FD|eukprot:scpid64068/ scgid4362/ Cytosolic acyl coenzyme A thioester hydrolase; Acyl-CoA thioesterase 7; Brain acyl-CoA hydrolase; CTE-IIa; Long chain acyl-CoA thioester hydrolase
MESLYWRSARRIFESFRRVRLRQLYDSPLRKALPALSFGGNLRLIAGGATGGGLAAFMTLGGASAADSVEPAGGNSPTQSTLCRVMLPDDANPSGNVHGGTILHLIEQAGWIVATRHCNSNKSSENSGFFSSAKDLSAALVRVEHMDFIQPMYIGEIAQITANVVFTSERSMEVRVEVWAENASKGQRRLTNQAILWYVAVPMDKETSAGHLKSQPVPPLPSNLKLRKEVAAAAKERYEMQKAQRAQAQELPGDTKLVALQPESDAVASSPAASQSSLQHVILPSECFANSIAQGGVIMKLMDTLAGVTAARHCRSPAVVTASLDAIDFHAPVLNGNLVTVTGRVTHTSKRSMEIEVIVFADNAFTGERKATNTAYFTFVTLNRLTGKVNEVPQLSTPTDEDKARFAEGQQRYDERKEARKAQKYTY